MCMHVCQNGIHTHTDIYIYIMTCIALHDFTIFYTYLSLYIYSTYIYSMSFTISTGHQRLRALWGLEPSIARLLRGAVDWHQLLGISVFFWEIMGIFYGNIYIICIYVLCIWLCIYVYMYYENDYLRYLMFYGIKWSYKYLYMIYYMIMYVYM